jgi:hypothetical protein
LDTGFALAKVQLADVLRSTARRDSLRLREADSLLTAVLSAHQDLPQALVVQGDLRSKQGQPDAGYRLMLRAAELRPNDAFVLGRLTWMQALRLDTLALSTGRRAVTLAPRDADMLRLVVAGTFVFRRFDEVAHYADRLIALDPTDYMGYLNKASAQAFARGDTAAAVRTLAEGERMTGTLPTPLAWGYAAVGPSGWKRWDRLRLADVAANSGLDTLDYYWWKAQIASAGGHRKDVRTFADSIVARSTAATSSDPGWRAVVQASRAFGYAVRGERAAGTRSLALADSLMSAADEAAQEQSRSYFVPALVLLGQPDQAIELARRIVRRPTGDTRRTLRFSPEFSSLWHLPEFQQLVADTSLP